MPLVKGFTVVLEEDLREEDARPLLEALKQMRGVLTVEPVPTYTVEQYATARIRRELITKLYDVLR